MTVVSSARVASTAIVAGLPGPTYTRIASALKAQAVTFPAGWEVRAVYSTPKRFPALNGDAIRDLIELAMKVTNAHVFCFQPYERGDRTRVEQAIQPFFRFRWLDSALLNRSPDDIPGLLKDLIPLLQDETVWATEVRPAHHSSPLILPECSFASGSDCRAMWQLAQDYTVDRMRAAAKMVELFDQRYARRRTGDSPGWKDADDRVFRYAGPYHGTPTSPLFNWKYSFRMPDQFHFDVMDAAEGRVRLYDFNRQLHQANPGAHINVDAHGRVR